MPALSVAIVVLLTADSLGLQCRHTVATLNIPMTTHDENRPAHAVRPPFWAELLLRLLLQPEDAETVSGDLLEEYRDTVYPSRGRWRANLWFVRQVGGFAWRGTAVWGLLVGLTAPTSFPVFTAWSLPLPALCLLLVASGRRTWRTGSVLRGVLAACSISAIATLVAIAVLLMRVGAAGEPSNGPGPMPILHEAARSFRSLFQC
jgi:hypothetical protein